MRLRLVTNHHAIEISQNFVACLRSFIVTNRMVNSIISRHAFLPSKACNHICHGLVPGFLPHYKLRHSVFIRFGQLVVRVPRALEGEGIPTIFFSKICAC